MPEGAASLNGVQRAAHKSLCICEADVCLPSQMFSSLAPTFSLFLPDVNITTSTTDLAGAYRAGAVDFCRCRAHLQGAGAAAADSHQSHVQFAVRPDRSLKLIACLGGVPRLTLRDRERTRCPVRTSRSRHPTIDRSPICLRMALPSSLYRLATVFGAGVLCAGVLCAGGVCAGVPPRRS